MGTERLGDGRESTATRSPDAHLSDDEFAEYVAEMLSSELEQAIEGHLAICEPCSRRIVSFREGEEEFTANYPPPVARKAPRPNVISLSTYRSRFALASAA